MMTNHLQRDRYGNFYLTDAIRPSAGLTILPREGYRMGRYRDRSTRSVVPMLVAAVSREKLFECFLDLLQPLGEVVDVILETSHDTPDGDHCDLEREGIDLPVLLSQFCEHEELLLNDGCTGVAVLDEEGTMEVQFDEHKLFVIYADDLEPFIEVLERHGIERDDRIQFLTEAEHLHSSSPDQRDEFERFCQELGIAEMAESVNW